MKTTYWAMLLMLLPSMAYTQTTEKENEFTMSIQIRPRAEYRNGALMPRNEREEPAGFINNRARLSMEYKRSDLQMKILLLLHSFYSHDTGYSQQRTCHNSQQQRSDMCERKEFYGK